MKAFGPSIALLLFALPSFAETYQVSSSNDSGPGTLRQAILDANGNPGTDSIVFTTSGVSGFGAMPQITGVVNIDGTVGNTTARINGLVFDGDTAFDFAAGSSGSTIRDVQVEDYPNAVRILTTNITVQNVQAPLTGLSLQGSNNLIGGTTAGTGNRFLLLSGAGDDNLILNNRISNINIIAAANNRFGNATIGNALGLVQINNCPGTIFENNVIGGGITINDSGTPSTGTRIIGNTMTNDGVAIGTATPGIEIARNSINNVGIPIDLGNNGPTANDAPPDADTGANNLQNYPMLTSAVFSGGVLRVNGMLMSVPFTLYRIEAFSDDAADPEARTYLGSFQVAIAATGTASFNGAISTTLPVAGEVITTTATNLSTSDTSEVSAPVAITFPGTFDFAPTTLTVNETDGTATLTVQRNGGIEGTTTVDYTTNDGTATAPSDYAQTSGTLTFAPGVTTHSILIPIVNDGIPEVEESFTVTLSNATGGAAVGAGAATVRIAAQLVADPTIPTLSEWGLIVMAIGLALAMLRASTA